MIEPGREIEVFDPEHAELAAAEDAAARKVVEHWGRRAKVARDNLEAVAKIAMTDAEFRATLMLGAADLVLGITEGEHRVRNADEASKVAARLVALASTADLSTVGKLVEQIEDPIERKELLEQFRKTARDRIAGK